MEKRRAKLHWKIKSSERKKKKTALNFLEAFYYRKTYYILEVFVNYLMQTGACLPEIYGRLVAFQFLYSNWKIFKILLRTR